MTPLFQEDNMTSSSFTDATFYFYIWSSLMIAVSLPLIWWLYQNYYVKNTKNKKRDNTNTSHGDREEHYSTIISRRHSGIEKVGSSETNKRYQRSISDSHESMQQESSAFLSHHHSSPKSESSSIYNIQKDYEELCTNLTKDFKTISQPQHISSNQSIQDQEASSTTIPRTNIFNTSNNINSKKKRQHIRSNSNPSSTFASYFQRDNMSNNENLNNGNNKSQNYNNCNLESEEESSSDSQDNDDNDGEDDDLHSRFAKRWPNIKTVSPYNKICLPPTCQKVEIVSSSSLGCHSYLQQYNIKTYRQIRYYAASHNYLNGVNGWIPSFFLQIKQFLENTIKIFSLFLPTGWRILTRSLFSFGKSNTEDKEDGGEENDVNGKINSDEGSERTIHHQNSFHSHEEEKKTDDNTSLILREGNTKLCTTPTNAPVPSSSSSYLPRNESVSSFMSLINDDEYEQKDQDQYYSLLATEQQQQSHPHISTIFSTYNNNNNNNKENNDIITAPKRTTNKEETTNSAISLLSSMKYFDVEATIIRQAHNNNNSTSNNNNLVMNAPDKYGYIFNFDNDFGLDAMPNNNNTNNTSFSAGISTSLASYRSIDGIHNFNSSLSNNSIHPFSHTPSSYALVSNHYNHHQQQHSSQPAPPFSATANTAATSTLLATSTAPQQQQQQLQSTNQFTPLLVFVNSRSGPQQGALLINQLRSLLNPIQIWDLSDGSPEPILQSFSVLKNLRIVSTQQHQICILLEFYVFFSHHLSYMLHPFYSITNDFSSLYSWCVVVTAQ